MTLWDNSSGRFLPFSTILILKQDLTFYTTFILRGGKDIINYFPFHFQKDVDTFCNSVLKTTWLKNSIKISNILVFVYLIKLCNKRMHVFIS